MLPIAHFGLSLAPLIFEIVELWSKHFDSRLLKEYLSCFTAAIVRFSAFFFPKFNVMYISCFVIIETLFFHEVKDLLLINCGQDWKKFWKIVELPGTLKNSLKHLEKVIYPRNYLEIARTFFLTSIF